MSAPDSKNTRTTGFFGLPSQWLSSLTPMNNGVAGRFEGEVSDLVIFGEVPKELDGTFYRIMVDPFYPLQEGNPPIEGDGNICAFRIHDGRVNMKTRYVDTERLVLERRANKRLFGLYRNPFSHHPCVQAAVDSTANTNLIFWAGRLLALKESAMPYAVDPDTLETLEYDPFGCPGKTFAAHPKYDPLKDELVCFGYEAKGLGTVDVVVYALDRKGQIHHETWVKSPWAAFIHDCAITANYIILVLWPYEANVDRMKNGGHHWQYNTSRPATFIVVPRRASQIPRSWAPNECRFYHWDHALLLHTAGAWEESDKIYLKSSRMAYNTFPIFDPESHERNFDFKADYVRWEIDFTKPTNSKVSDPRVILDMPSEMVRMDERYFTRPYDRLFCPVVAPKQSPLPPVLPVALNAYLMFDKESGKKITFDPGSHCTVEEPIFIPRSDDAVEGDGWVMGMVQRMDVNRSDVVVLDTKAFSQPVAVIQLPFRTKMQVHGNWVDSTSINLALGRDRKDFLREYKIFKVGGNGALGSHAEERRE
ncbi:lignostilbene dioxygenase family [Fusarium albosuccineum]|uniref:Lignostilbene dioxygenase family n=1 Tax=Fusarium albosuccineum TaxID=1237068 RepID=A0A8H4P7U1_9HYPO|nr:lignostilbene dioxygenase family [Fusarium albosuccineum]